MIESDFRENRGSVKITGSNNPFPKNSISQICQNSTHFGPIRYFGKMSRNIYYFELRQTFKPQKFFRNRFLEIFSLNLMSSEFYSH